MPPPGGSLDLLQDHPEGAKIYSGVVVAALYGDGSGKKYGFIRVDETGNDVFVSEKHAPYGWLEKGNRVVFRIIQDRLEKGRTKVQFKAVDVKLERRV